MPPKLPWVVRYGATAVVGIVLGVGLAWLLDPPPAPSTVRTLLLDFPTSPGLGGLAAVVAAFVAYTAARKSREATERAGNLAQWWENARWATDMLLTSSIADKAELATGARKWKLSGVFSRPSWAKGRAADRSGWQELSDPDAEAAIIVLKHLGATAPNTELNAFIMQVMGQVLGVADGEPATDLPGVDPEPER